MLTERRKPGRPRKEASAPIALPHVPRFRVKSYIGGPRLQMTEPHPGGVRWVDVPTVPETAQDWENA